MNTIEIEWDFCKECGLPVVEEHGIKHEVFVHGEFGRGQIKLDIEHECN